MEASYSASALSHSSMICRDYLVQVAYDSVVRNFEDRSIRILVDSNDAVGVLHTCQMLDSAGDTASEVDFRLNGCTGLTYLVGVINPASVNSCSGRTNNSANLVSELFDQFESGRIAQATSAGADDFSVSQGNQFLSGLNDVNQLDVECLLSAI